MLLLVKHKVLDGGCVIGESQGHREEGDNFRVPVGFWHEERPAGLEPQVVRSVVAPKRVGF